MLKPAETNAAATSKADSSDMFLVLRLTQPPLQYLTILAGRGTTSYGA